MQNLAKINELEFQLYELVKQEIDKLETISLIPNVIDVTDADYWDWLYDLPIVNVEGQGYYIINVVKSKYDILLNGLNVDDSRDIIELSIYDLSLSNKLHLLQSVNDVIEYTEKLSQKI